MADEKKPDEPMTTEEKIDDAVDDTFPASDPPSVGGSTGPEDTSITGPRTHTS